MRVCRFRGPVTFGWSVVAYGREVIAVRWQPYDDVPNSTGKPWEPFKVCYWQAIVTVFGKPVWKWRRWGHRYRLAVWDRAGGKAFHV